MKIKQLRLVQGCHALKSDNNFTDGKDTSIEMIGGGNFLVKFYGKVVFIPGHQVHFAVCEPDSKK